MLNKGINITWYIIGFGVAEELIKEKIREEKMEKSRHSSRGKNKIHIRI